MGRGRRVAGTLAVVAVVALVGWIDATTTSRLSFAVFYLIPVAATGWRMGRAAALLVAVAAGGAWLAADLTWHAHDSPKIIAWNATTRLIIFAALGWLSARLHTERQSLLEANARLRELAAREAVRARTDALTSLPNFAGFREHLEREMARSHRTGEPLSIAYVDLDQFKAINDHYGHAGGDEALKRVSQALRGSIRTMDIPARTGGDEFVVVLPGADAEAARAVGERIVASIGEVAQHYPDAPLGASVGLVCTTATPSDSGDELIRRADAAMYRAKREGKGRVMLDETPPASPPSEPPRAGAG